MSPLEEPIGLVLTVFGLSIMIPCFVAAGVLTMWARVHRGR